MTVVIQKYKFVNFCKELYFYIFISVPSQPPTAFKLTATSSTNIVASWQLPPVYARHSAITGFKLFYTKKGSGLSVTTLTISGESTFSSNVTGLDKYTEHEFQVLAFSSDGDGPKSSVEVERTMVCDRLGRMTISLLCLWFVVYLLSKCYWIGDQRNK